MQNQQEKTNKLKSFLSLGRTLGYWTRGYDFPRHCRQVFNCEDFSGKNVLEIGCGKGLLSLWASLHGANNVVGLEPLTEGRQDSSKIYSEFAKIVDVLKLKNIEMRPERIQDYNNKNRYFDIVLSHSSVNHLDEDACIHLQDSDVSINIYADIFRSIADKMNDGGRLIILDCSSKNFFTFAGITNPMASQIEWFKHQTPEVWVKLLLEVGFTQPQVTWPSGRYLRYLRIFKRHKGLSYFMNSYFRIEMKYLKR